MAQFSHIAGDPSLDLLNTVEWRLGGPDREEDLTTFADVLTWCREANLLSEDEAGTLTLEAHQDSAVAEEERLTVIALREAAYQALFEHDDSSAQVLADLHRQALSGARLARSDGAWRWHDERTTLSTPRHRIARALVELLGRDDLAKLHQCEDAKCGWVYFDTSPRRNRRWCAASGCGDRNRARAYYTRKAKNDATPEERL